VRAPFKREIASLIKSAYAVKPLSLVKSAYAVRALFRFHGGGGFHAFTKPLRWLAILGVCASCTGAGAADIVKWKDASGRTHYGDRPPEGQGARPVAAPGIPGSTPSAEVKVAESVVRYYDVRGSSSQDLYNAFQSSGPADRNGRRNAGLCTWRMDWEFSFARSAGKCAIEKFSITVSSTIDLPRWSNREAGTPALRSTWDRFSTALRMHEDGHRDNGVRVANAVAGRLRTLPAEKDCAAMNQRIAAVTRDVQDAHKDIDAAYDRATNRGETQGVKIF
jgi:predicted secreted Zn-dependent protease